MVTVSCSEFLALAVAETQANGFVIGQGVPPIFDTLLTIVKEKNCSFIYLKHAINCFVKLFLLLSTNLTGSPCTLVQWRDFVVNTIAMTFKIQKRTW